MGDVLIVDDRPADREDLAALLSQDGHRPHLVGLAADLLDRAAEVRPHLVILGPSLADDVAQDACRRLRADPRLSPLPILAVLAANGHPCIQSLLAAGVDDVIAPEEPPRILLARAGRLIRSHQLASSSILNEQLAQLGRLLAGIVHEIRGPLGVIRGNAELMRLQLPEGDPVLSFVDPILRGALVLQARLEHLMATVRGGRAVLRPLPLGPLVREAADYFRKGSDARAARVEVVLAAESSFPEVHADAGRLIQVLLNLLANARDSLATRESGGRIHLRARAGPEPGGPRDGHYIEVADDGPGIPEAIIERIFEPYFTTKEAGTGYGLYLAREILREHDGHLLASNEPAGGACFALWLPAPAQVPTNST